MHFEKTGLQVLTVNANKPNILNQVRPYINKRKYKFPVAVDPRGKLAKQFGVVGYPYLIMVDKDGLVIHKSSGYEDGQEDTYLKYLKEYLDNQRITYDNFSYKKQGSEKKETDFELDF